MTISSSVIYRLKPAAGQAAPVNSVGANEAFTGGTMALVDLGGGIFAWEFTGAVSSVTIPSKVVDNLTDGGGVTMALTLRRVASPTVAGQTMVAWSNSAESAGMIIRRGSSAPEDIGFRGMFGSQSTASKTGVSASTLQTYVVKMSSKTASLQDMVMVWVQQAGRVGTTADSVGPGDTLSQQTINTIRINPTNGGDYQIVDLVLWGSELTDAECAAVADNLRGVLDALVAGPTISTQPTSKSATSGTQFSFSVVAEASGGGALSYKLQRNGADVSGATSATYTGTAGVDGVTGDVFRFVVTETGGTNPGSTTSSSATLTVTSAADTTRPSLTGSIAIDAVTSTSIAFSWPTATDNVGVTGYEVSKDGGTTWVDTGSLATNYTFNALTQATSYQLRVRAKDAANNYSTPVLAITQATSAATSSGTFTSGVLKRLGGELVGATTLSWLKLVNPATGVDIVLKTAVAVNGSSIFQTADAALAKGTTYAAFWREVGGAYGRGEAVAT